MALASIDELPCPPPAYPSCSDTIPATTLGPAPTGISLRDPSPVDTIPTHIAMNQIAEEVLKRLGYLSQDGSPSDGLLLESSASPPPLDAVRLTPLLSTSPPALHADAVFRVGASPVIVFKSGEPSPDKEYHWHRLAWNLGAAPVLWVTTPEYIRLYNAFQPPPEYAKSRPLLREVPIRHSFDTALSNLGSICGRRQVAMGSFWKSQLASKIDRQHRVDNVLLRELQALLRVLLQNGLPPNLAQKLIGRCIFFQYLVHRGHLTKEAVESKFGSGDLHSILTDIDATYEVFRWIRDTFNGDLFPIEDETVERREIGDPVNNLRPLSDFFGHFDIKDRQGRLFPFRFDAIPAELISSIYEQFVRISETPNAKSMGVHYTPLNLVALLLDPVFEEVRPEARVLDLSCGSGVFLVESLRRLVWLASQRAPLDRDIILRILLDQIRGVDISPVALSLAAFSLYIALLELDPTPPHGVCALEHLRLPSLLGRVLFATSAFDPHLDTVLFPHTNDNCADVIVGNPPWTYDPSEKAEDRSLQSRSPPVASYVPFSLPHAIWNNVCAGQETAPSSPFSRLAVSLALSRIQPPKDPRCYSTEGYTLF